MNLIPKLQTTNRQQRLHSLRWVVSLLTAFMIVVGQSAAVGAVNDANGLGWMEICASEDVQFAPPEGSSDERSCVHCDYCTIQSGANSGVLSTPASVFVSAEFTPIFIHSDQSTTVLRAEQYWAANRGPPKLSKETTMTILFSLAHKELAVGGVKLWSFPWT